MERPGIPLREFLLAAQRDVQQVLEHLASPETRRMGPGAPAAVIATVGAVKLAVPVTFHLVPARGRAAAAGGAAGGPGPAPDPSLAGPAPDPGAAVWDPDAGAPGPGVGTAATAPPPRARWELRVATPATCPPGAPLGRVEVEFITCPKQYGD